VSSKQSPSHFLNVDLEITSRSKLDLFSVEIKKKTFVLYSGRQSQKNLLILECCGSPKNANAAIDTLCAIIEKVSPAARRIWDSAEKIFDIGWESEKGDQSSRIQLKSATLKRITALGATIAVTHYPTE
jgi:cob(I)alamin adenosyltransferase